MKTLTDLVINGDCRKIENALLKSEFRANLNREDFAHSFIIAGAKGYDDILKLLLNEKEYINMDIINAGLAIGAEMQQENSVKVLYSRADIDKVLKNINSEDGKIFILKYKAKKEREKLDIITTKVQDKIKNIKL